MKFLVYFSFLLSPLIAAPLTHPVMAISSQIKVIHSIETNDCWISFIMDEEGKAGIVKQIKNEDPDEQFLLVIDAMACSIAQEQGLPINQVTLIPPEMSFPGKKLRGRLATLHSLALGSATSETFPWQDFDLHQRIRNEWQRVTLEESGLTPTVIHHMSLHPALPLIAALDTFTGNADRSNPNIFYDPHTDSFCGIDMAAAFCSLLAAPSCFQINRILQGDVVLSKKEIAALGFYRLQLNSLIEKYPPEKLCNRLDHYAKQAGFSEEVQNRIEHHKNIIRQNYADSRELLHLLNSREFLDILDSWP